MEALLWRWSELKIEGHRIGFSRHNSVSINEQKNTGKLAIDLIIRGQPESQVPPAGFGQVVVAEDSAAP